MTTTNHSILKSDRRGRLRYSKDQKSALVEAYQTSGLSGPRFAALHGVNYQTLASWLQKHQQTACTAVSRQTPTPPFLLVTTESPSVPHTGPMELILPGGVKLAITATAHIPLAAALIRELANPRPC
jgi:transposase-like protein